MHRDDLARSYPGGSIVMPHRFSVSQWWALVERYRPTWLNVVPTIIAYLINAPDRSAPRRLRRAAAYASRRSASAPLPPEQHRAFEARFGISVLEAMGLTECASVAFANPLDPRERRIRIARDGRSASRRGSSRPIGTRSAAAGTGEIELRGDNVMLGYHKDRRSDCADAARRRLARDRRPRLSRHRTASTSSPAG